MGEESIQYVTTIIQINSMIVFIKDMLQLLLPNFEILILNLRLYFYCT